MIRGMMGEQRQISVTGELSSVDGAFVSGGQYIATTACKETYDISMTDGTAKKYHFRCSSDEPLLEGIRRTLCKGIPRGCSGGGCGVCKVIVRKGKISAFKPMSRAHVTEEEIAHNVVLACCVNPRSDLEIDLFTGYN